MKPKGLIVGSIKPQKGRADLRGFFYGPICEFDFFVVVLQQTVRHKRSAGMQREG